MLRQTQRSRTPPFFTAPQSVLWLTGLVVLAHGLRIILPEAVQNDLFYWFALIPQRLDFMLSGAAAGDAYSPLGLLIASFGHAGLHGDWLHVIMNMGMLLALGTPLARRLSTTGFLLVFFASVLAGAATFFAVSLLLPAVHGGALAIGASGGVSGVLAGAFMLMADPRAGWSTLISRSFLTTSAAFLVINAILAFGGPALLGTGIAWEAHIGGYVVGALVMAALSGRRWD